ncbi:uncharacterized protein LOC114399844 isoform X3 [Glycine soja]|uniref:uncharacterized protein LOC114399844 isoform X3 n=1 Tax=Glycine soja TaxID=3848 RepID=UPI0003DEB606|nr:uncharacterized protein LOC114399844 isoform X3 [Glycine soja]XP_040864992.1 uncharacterized protein LOC100527563 isoform X3 [Glycine max]|eukprot:XP_014625538.1 uncharacterized protein LOC100527563 isoform X3 [Glycine max]
MAAITATTRRTKTPPSPKAFKHVSFCGVVCGIHPHIFSFQFAFAFHLALCFFQEASFRHRWPRSMKLLPETPRTARRSSKPSALSATPSTKVPTTNKTYQTFSAYTIEECGRKIGLMAQILLHGTLHATVYEVDKLKIGGGNFLTKMGSKMAIVIVALFAVLLFISPEVACRDFKEELGEVVKETNEESDARLAGSGGGDLDLSHGPWIGNCRRERHVPDRPSRPRAY